jgi:thioredoxin reductase (NADPH)
MPREGETGFDDHLPGMIASAELRATPLLRDSKEEMVAFVARNAADLRVEAGDWIIREGEAARFFIVIDGTVEILKIVTGRLSKIGEFAAGDSFGEVPLLLGSPAVANIRATSTARLARLDGMAFWHVMHADDAFAHAVLANMSRRIEFIRDATVKAPPARCTIVGDSTFRTNGKSATAASARSRSSTDRRSTLRQPASWQNGSDSP